MLSGLFDEDLGVSFLRFRPLALHVLKFALHDFNALPELVSARLNVSLEQLLVLLTLFSLLKHFIHH